MDKLEQVKKEIERRRDIFRTSVASIDGCKANVLTDILSFIDSLQEEPHCDERQFDELVKLQEGIGQIAKAVYEHKGKENPTVEKIREILIENSFDRMEIRGEILSDDLEKEICNYFNNWYFDEEMDIMVKPNHYSARFDDIKAVARHFAEWQKEKDQKK